MDLVKVVIDFQEVPSVDQVNEFVEALAPNLSGRTTFAPVGDNHADVSFYGTTVEVSLAAESFTRDDAEPTARGEIDLHDSARNVVARALADLDYSADAARIVQISPPSGD